MHKENTGVAPLDKLFKEVLSMLMTKEQLEPYRGLAELYKPYIQMTDKGKLYMPENAPEEAKKAWAKQLELDKQYEDWG